MDLSGWLPKYVPEAVMNEAKKRLSDRILFGSDYPFILPERWLEDFDALDGFTPEVKRKLLHDNAAALLGLR
jgi:predicted TIM-barrel fold metal-dependent hydrolase